jgi:hypothetical protein
VWLAIISRCNSCTRSFTPLSSLSPTPALLYVYSLVPRRSLCLCVWIWVCVCLMFCVSGPRKGVFLSLYSLVPLHMATHDSRSGRCVYCIQSVEYAEDERECPCGPSAAAIFFTAGGVAAGLRVVGKLPLGDPPFRRLVDDPEAPSRLWMPLPRRRNGAGSSWSLSPPASGDRARSHCLSSFVNCARPLVTVTSSIDHTQCLHLSAGSPMLMLAPQPLPLVPFRLVLPPVLVGRRRLSLRTLSNAMDVP